MRRRDGEDGMGRWSALLVAALAFACGGGDANTAASAASLDVDGVLVALNSSAPFAHAPDFPARLESTLQAALTFWGGTWRQVQGRTITFVDDPTVPCGDAQALGCFEGSITLTTRDPGTGTVACVEQTVLVHEIGHLILGDPLHTDPRWMEMTSLAAELGGQPGYTASGETRCTAYESVWQHPIGTP